MTYKEQVLARYPLAVCKRVQMPHGGFAYVVFTEPEGMDESRALNTGSIASRFAWEHAASGDDLPNP